MKTIVSPPFLYAPNTFTINGDDLNEYFRFRGVGIKLFNLLFYHRGRELMFQFGNRSNGWNDKYKGKRIPEGSYVCKFFAESYENIVFEKSGNLALIR